MDETWHCLTSKKNIQLISALVVFVAWAAGIYSKSPNIFAGDEEFEDSLFVLYYLYIVVLWSPDTIVHVVYLAVSLITTLLTLCVHPKPHTVFYWLISYLVLVSICSLAINKARCPSTPRIGT